MTYQALANDTTNVSICHVNVNFKTHEDMRRSDLNKFLTPEDKMMVAVKYEVDPSYVRHLLRNERAAESETAKAILNDLETLACENILWFRHKKELIAA